MKRILGKILNILLFIGCIPLSLIFVLIILRVIIMEKAGHVVEKMDK